VCRGCTGEGFANETRNDGGKAMTTHEKLIMTADAGAPGRERRIRLVSNVVGHLRAPVSEPVLQRAFQYWRNVDKHLGDRVEAGVRSR
jgi:hypothetical protein